ncbi:DNA-binding protein RFX8, partial [Acanthisitta chloris]
SSSLTEVTRFAKRLRRQIDLCVLVKAVRIHLQDDSTVTVLQSGLQAVLNEIISLDVATNIYQKKLRKPKKEQKTIQAKCLETLISSLTHSTDIWNLLNKFSSDLQTLIIKPNKSLTVFKNQAAEFMLHWNVLLRTVGKILSTDMTDSFG